MRMTPGQELAVEQLRAIQEADPTAFEVVKTWPPSPENPCLTVMLSLSCRGIERVPGGLPLRERERFVVWILPTFPFSVPQVCTIHNRFAGKPHVQWKRQLCIYQAPQTEWDAADGMFGLIDRLWVWLEHGARNLADPEGQPIHPPVAYTGESKYLIVPRADTPVVTDRPWYGFAGLRSVNERTISIVNWQPASNQGDPTGPVAAVILLPQSLPWEMPTKLEGLCKELAAAGATEQLLLALLQWTLLVNPKEHPLFVVVGAPQRGIQSSGQLKQHLMAWQVSGPILTVLNVSADSIRMLFGLEGLNTPAHEDLRQSIKANKAECERLAVEWLKLFDVNWCAVLEDRPEVTTRRDERSPLSIFRGKHVCLWGCGALGSHVAYYLVKAGVRKLTMMDNGIVRPGLLVRQMFEEAEVGEAKAVALKRRLEKMHPGVEIEAFQKTVLAGLAVTDQAMIADYVIDCTASDFVHAKSEVTWATEDRKRPPIISMIVGPRAERGIAVLTTSTATGAIKDAFRKAKLIACQKPELVAFADGFYPKGNTIKFFQPEPGCSDPTFEGSSADVAGLAALLLNAGASLLKKTITVAGACFVCQPHLAKRGQVSYAEFILDGDIVCQNDYLVRLSRKAWKEMAAAIRQSRRKRGAICETGGLMFGKRDDALRIIWIDDAIGPPPDSTCRPEIFICGVQGTQDASNKRKQRSRGSTEFIGMWHTHPQDMPFPSQTDIAGMEQLLTSGEKPPLKSLLLIAGWAGDEVLLGTSIFDRRIFQKGGSMDLGVTRVPHLLT